MERTFWEIGVDLGNDEGTKTVLAADSLLDALKYILIQDDDTAFIDLWESNTYDTRPLDQFITKKDLIELTRTYNE